MLSLIVVLAGMQLLTTTTISWNKMAAMILKVYMHIYIVLLIVYPQFGKQSFNYAWYCKSVKMQKKALS